MSTEGREGVREEAERRALYQQLLAYYNEHGVIPDFTVRAPEEKKR